MYKTPGVVPVGLTWDQNPDIDGLLYGWKWDTNNITYSFPTSTDEYTYNFNPLYDWTGDMGYEEIDGFQAFNGTQQSAVKAILNKNISSFATGWRRLSGSIKQGSGESLPEISALTSLSLTRGSSLSTPVVS